MRLSSSVSNWISKKRSEFVEGEFNQFGHFISNFAKSDRFVSRKKKIQGILYDVMLLRCINNWYSCLLFTSDCIMILEDKFDYLEMNYSSKDDLESKKET